MWLFEYLVMPPTAGAMVELPIAPTVMLLPVLDVPKYTARRPLLLSAKVVLTEMLVFGVTEIWEKSDNHIGKAETAKLSHNRRQGNKQVDKSNFVAGENLRHKQGYIHKTYECSEVRVNRPFYCLFCNESHKS